VRIHVAETFFHGWDYKQILLITNKNKIHSKESARLILFVFKQIRFKLQSNLSALFLT